MNTFDAIFRTMSKTLLFLLMASNILFFYAGYRDARKWTNLDLGKYLSPQYVIARCATPSTCEFVYQVNDVALLISDFGKTDVRTPKITRIQEIKTEDLNKLEAFWTKQSNAVQVAEAAGLFHLLKDAIKNSHTATKLKAEAKGGPDGFLAKRVTIAGALIAVSYGTGFFVSEHWFPSGPGSPEQVALMKLHLATSNFQRKYLSIATLVWRRQSENWTAAAITPPECAANQTLRNYSPTYATDETLSKVDMTEPCSRLEFQTMLSALDARERSMSETGQALRAVDVQLLAGMQRYGSIQNQNQTQVIVEREPESNILINVLWTIGAIAAIAAFATVIFFMGRLANFMTKAFGRKAKT